MLVTRTRQLARLLSPGLLAGVPHELPLLRGGQALVSTLAGGGTCTGSSNSSTGDSACSIGGLAPSWLLGRRPFSAAAAADASGLEAADAADELPLWRYLRQQGFSAGGISRMRTATRASQAAGGRQYKYVTGERTTEQKLQRDVVPNIAALRAEGLDTASIEQLFVQFPKLLTTRHATFSSALAALRQLAALLPDDPRAVQAPAGATQLGVALWRYPSVAAHLLARANLGSLIDGNVQLRRQLGVSDAATAARVWQNMRVLAGNFEQAEAMAAHLQRLQASGALSQEEVVGVALTPGALHLTPAEFDLLKAACGLEGVRSSVYKDPAGRQRAAAEALGELLQAADGVPGPLQPQFRQQGEGLVQREPNLWRAGPAALRASWASLQQLGLSSSQVVATVRVQPLVLAYNWDGEAKQRLLAWAQQELGLSPSDFLTRHAGYTSYSTATLAMRADYLRQHRPAVWEERLARGTGPLLSTLTYTSRFLAHAGCTQAELAAFNRAWLATPSGRRWGGSKIWQKRRKA